MKRINEGLAIDLINALHTFNLLTSSKIDKISQLFEFDAKDFCNYQGITYDEDENDTISLTKEEIKTFQKDSLNGIWSDSSYKICKFIEEDPSDGI